MNWIKLESKPAGGLFAPVASLYAPTINLPPALPDHDYPESAIVLTAWWERDHYWYVTGFYTHDEAVWRVNSGEPGDFAEMTGAPEYWSFIEDALPPQQPR